MNFLKNSIKIGALLLFGTIYAQQQPNYALYRYTMNAINPAYAGADGVSRLTANFRSQWVSVEDAPETQTLFFETSLATFGSENVTLSSVSPSKKEILDSSILSGFRTDN